MGRSRLQTLRLLLTLSLTASVLIVVGGASPAAACSCIRGNPEEALENDVVFVGTPIKRTPFGGAPKKQNAWGKSGPGGYITTFEVERVYRGDVGPTQRVVTSASLAGGCGMVFRGGRRVVVVANVGPEHAFLLDRMMESLNAAERGLIQLLPSTNLCTSLNAPSVGQAADLFGSGRSPR